MASVLIIGNSPNVLTKQLGALIDASPHIIVRFNKIPPDKYHKHVGARTSLFVQNGGTYLHSRYSGALTLRVAEPCTSPIVKRIPKDIRFSDSWKQWLQPRAFPTSGFIAIAHYVSVGATVFLYGFDFSGSHYYDRGERNGKGALHHNYDSEREAVACMHEKGLVRWFTE